MNPRSPQTTELSPILLAAALSLLLGYVWGQHDAHQDLSATMQAVTDSNGRSIRRLETALEALEQPTHD